MSGSPPTPTPTRPTPPSASPSPRATSARTSRPPSPPDPERPLRRGRRPVHSLQGDLQYPPLRVQQVWIDSSRPTATATCLGEAGLAPSSSRRDAGLYLHVATTVARRAERQAWAAIAAYGDQPGTTRGEGGIHSPPSTSTGSRTCSSCSHGWPTCPSGATCCGSRAGGASRHRTKKAAASDAGPGSAGAEGPELRGGGSGVARLGDVDVEPWWRALQPRSHGCVCRGREADPGRCPRRSGRSPPRPPEPGDHLVRGAGGLGRDALAPMSAAGASRAR